MIRLDEYIYRWSNLFKTRMISIEECKKYIGNLNLNDKQIEDVRDLLYAFVEQSLDYVVNSGIVALSKNKEKNKEYVKQI